MFVNEFLLLLSLARRRPAAKRGGQPPMPGVWGGAAPPVRNKVLLDYVRHQYGGMIAGMHPCQTAESEHYNPLDQTQETSIFVLFDRFVFVRVTLGVL